MQSQCFFFEAENQLNTTDGKYRGVNLLNVMQQLCLTTSGLTDIRLQSEKENALVCNLTPVFYVTSIKTKGNGTAENWFRIGLQYVRSTAVRFPFPGKVQRWEIRNKIPLVETLFCTSHNEQGQKMKSFLILPVIIPPPKVTFIFSFVCS